MKWLRKFAKKIILREINSRKGEFIDYLNKRMDIPGKSEAQERKIIAEGFDYAIKAIDFVI